MLHMLLGISWYVYAMPISHFSPVDIPLTPRFGLFFKVLYPHHHYSSGLNFESFGTLMKFWVCLKIRYPKIRMVYHHSPHQKLPFGLHFQTLPGLAVRVWTPMPWRFPARSIVFLWSLAYQFVYIIYIYEYIYIYICIK